jgi:hypothetical protein
LKRLTILLLSGVLILAACAQALTNEASTPRIPDTETNTVQSFTSTPLPSKTPRQRMYEPTNTPLPPTPLPTIPTFTPTFDLSTIVTVTPALHASCPTENTEVKPAFSDSIMFTPDEILTYLNSGGTLEQLSSSQRDPGWGRILDLTGDGVPEIVYETFVRYDVLGCKGGKYESLFGFSGDFDVTLGGTPDLNKNRIPELIFYDISHYGFADIFIFEWDGNKFHSLINMGTDTSTGTIIDAVSATSPHKITDLNGDGLGEIVIVYDVHETESWPFGIGMYVASQRPLRNQSTTLGWNGQNFVDLTPGNDVLPVYRFQAIQDGDEQTHYGNYSNALSFYQEAIFSDQLEWWSPERRDYEVHIAMSRIDARPTVSLNPSPDNTEYPRLAAYAYYRIMLLHFIQGHAPDAGTVYKTLEQKFSNDPYGRPYFEMATAFWEAYQSTQKIYDSCAAAIEYATAHPEILVPLGSEYHGGYSHTYLPADVCPFR